MKSIVVTGVSTGIGYGTADELCRRGFRVFGSVRTEEDAARLQHTFGDNFTPLVFDVTDVALAMYSSTARGIASKYSRLARCGWLYMNCDRDSGGA